MIRLLFAAGSLLVAIGLLLIKRGWWPRRRGDTAYCRRCGYNLTGTPGACCPECGSELTPAARILGERPRRPVQAAVGLVLCAAGLLCHTHVLRGIEWYSFVPTSSLITQIRWGLDSERAFTTLHDRLVNHRLSAAEEHALVELFLQLQAGAWHPPGLAFLSDDMGYHFYRHDKLDGRQTGRFLSQMVRPVDLRVQPPAPHEQGIPFTLDYVVCGPPVLNYIVRMVDVTMDGQPAGELAGSLSAYTSVGTDGTKCLRARVLTPTGLAPGTHTLSASVQVTLLDAASSEPIYQAARSLSHTFEWTGSTLAR